MWHQPIISPSPERTDVLLSLLVIAIGFALLVFGANFLVDGACSIARRLGVPDRVAGLTIVAVGTSLPELVVSVTSAVGGHADMAFGNVVGSCLANLLLILGLSAVIAPVTLSRSTQRFEIPVSVAACGLLALLANTGGQVTMLLRGADRESGPRRGRGREGRGGGERGR